MSEVHHITALAQQILDNRETIGLEPSPYELTRHERLTQELWKAVRLLCIPVRSIHQ